MQYQASTAPPEWAEDEDEIQAAKLESQMEVMENFYNDLLLEQLQAQEEYFSKKAELEGIYEIYEKVSSEEKVDRSVIAAKWLQELKLFVHNKVVTEMRSRAKQLRQQEHKIKEELEIHEVMLTTANATKDKYKKFLAVAGSSTTTTASAAAAASSKKNSTTSSDQQPQKPQTLEDVPTFIDKHPEVVALEKELEKLINEMTAM